MKALQYFKILGTTNTTAHPRKHDETSSDIAGNNPSL
jgi:hypothetical protein